MLYIISKPVRWVYGLSRSLAALKQEGKMPTGITDENIHYWPSSHGELMVSIEDTKTLMSFKTLDDAINWLYLKGFKKSARQIHGDW